MAPFWAPDSLPPWTFLRLILFLSVYLPEFTILPPQSPGITGEGYCIRPVVSLLLFGLFLFLPVALVVMELAL